MRFGRFRLGLDLDGVVAGFKEGYRWEVMEQTGLPAHCFPEPTDFSFRKSGWFEKDEEFTASFLTAVENGLYSKLPLIEGSKQALDSLADAGVEIVVVTQRWFPGMNLQQVEDETGSWITQHELPVSDIHFLNDKSTVPGGADVFVDDAPHHITALHQAGCEVLVYDQLYNQQVTVGRRVGSWSGNRNGSQLPPATAEIFGRYYRHQQRKHSAVVGGVALGQPSRPQITPHLPQLAVCGKRTLTGQKCRRVGACPFHA